MTVPLPLHIRKTCKKSPSKGCLLLPCQNLLSAEKKIQEQAYVSHNVLPGRVQIATESIWPVAIDLATQTSPSMDAALILASW